MVGMYKCGTSWLLHMLAAHPQAVAWREFDAIRAVYELRRPSLTRPLAALDYVYPRPTSTAWMQRQETSLPRAPRDIFREMFLGHGWIPLMGLEKQAQASGLDPQDLENLLDELLVLGNYRLRPQSALAIDPSDVNKALGVQSFRRGDLLELMHAVRDSQQIGDIPALFFDGLRSQLLPGTRVVTKAADQLMQLKTLKRASPEGRAIAIVRDGRDAAISARHFEALMREREAPWLTHSGGFVRRLLGWSIRAAKLAEHAKRGDVTIIRYEDLHEDYSKICRALFLELGLDANDKAIDQTRAATDFATVTQGRARGESAEHHIRKGITGEWQEALSKSEAGLAWQLAGKSLAAFGYTQSGVVEPSTLVLSDSSNSG